MFVFIVFTPWDMASTSRGRDGRDGWEDGTSLGGRAGTNYLPTLLGRDRTRKEPLRWTEECAVFRFFLLRLWLPVDILEHQKLLCVFHGSAAILILRYPLNPPSFFLVLLLRKSWRRRRPRADSSGTR